MNRETGITETPLRRLRTFWDARNLAPDFRQIIEWMQVSNGKETWRVLQGFRHGRQELLDSEGTCQSLFTPATLPFHQMAA